MDNGWELGVSELVAFEAAWREVGSQLNGLADQLIEHWRESDHGCAVDGCAGEGLSAAMDGLTLDRAVPLLHVAVFRIAKMRMVAGGQ